MECNGVSKSKLKKTKLLSNVGTSNSNDAKITMGFAGAVIGNR